MKKLSLWDCKILLLTTPGQDYMQDDLLYGFRGLLGGRAVDFPRKDILYADFEGYVHQRPEYAMNARYFIDDPVDRSLPVRPEDFDLVINLSCRRNGGKADIYVDGEDDTVISTPQPGGVLFKRELMPDHVSGIMPKAHPITFGLPDHLAPLMPQDGMFETKTVNVHSSFTVAHGPNRRELASVFPVTKCITREKYTEALNEARFVLSPKGAGWDCQRHYEILGRAVPIVEVVPGQAPEHFVSMWRDGENCLTFDGKPATILEKLKSVDSKKWNKMIIEGYGDLYNKYLATEVAVYLLRTAGAI